MSELKKVVTLESDELLLLEQIIIDADKEESLKFLKKIKEKIERQDKSGLKSHL